MTGLPRALLLGALALAGAAPAAGQAEALLGLDDPRLVLVERLQRRGHLGALDPTSLPYREGDVAAALAALDPAALDRTARVWADRLRRTLAADSALGGDRVRLAFDGHVGTAAANTRRLDAVRAVGAGGATLPVGAGALFPFASVALLAERPGLALRATLRHDVAYNDDPDGLDLAHRLMTRSDETYARVRRGLVALTLGRYRQHWGRPGADAVLLSGHARSFDRVAFRFGGRRLALESLLGELDSAGPDGGFTGRAGDAPGAVHRFLAAHRLRAEPGAGVSVVVFESVLYSGAGVGPSLRYLNPLHAFALETDATPKNVENNGFVGLELGLDRGRTTATAQLLLDDFDFLNGTEPVSVAATAVVARGGVRPNVDARAGASVVTLRTYNTHQPEGRYVFARRGLGLPFTDYAHVWAQADWFATPDLALSPRVEYLAQGEGTVFDPYPANDAPALFAGTAERTARAALRLRYDPAPHVRRGAFVAGFAEADLGVNRTTGAAHTPGATRTRAVGLVRLGLRARFGGTFGVTGR